MALANKRILLGVTGGVAAYKSADLVRRLRDAGAQVRVVMTRAATKFITPLTLQAVSGQPVHLKLLDAESETAMGHIELARWADAILIAPATAHFIAKLAQGYADDLLSTLCLAADAPIAIAPAMNQGMWQNAATQDNVGKLRMRGITLLGPEQGSQACGEVGPGRLLEPVALIAGLEGVFRGGTLAGVTVMITAGPTRETIDPARILTNRSSGKMGYAIAEAAVAAGARVVLVSGPTSLAPPERVDFVPVTSAREMYEAVHARLAGVAIFIGVAAVTDYRPVETRAKKLKREQERITLELVRNPDILLSVAESSPRPYTVGFAAESEELEHNARKKLFAKKLDLIVANLISSEAGFESDENSVLLLDRHETQILPRAHKDKLARQLIDYIAGRYNAKNPIADTRQAHRQ